MSKMVHEEPPLAAHLRDVGLFAASSVAVPFVVTGLYRLWDRVHVLVPFALVILIAASVWRLPSIPRSIPYGLAAGAAVWLVFLLWLFAEVGAGLGGL